MRVQGSAGGAEHLAGAGLQGGQVVHFNHNFGFVLFFFLPFFYSSPGVATWCYSCGGCDQ